jgi:hypothetical protein
MTTTKTKAIQALLGASYSWDDKLNELNFRGNPLSDQWQTPHERSAVAQVNK